MFLPVFFDCSSSFGYAGCVDTTKSISCVVSYTAVDQIDQLTCPVDDCPPSFIHHPGKTASRYGPHYTSAPPRRAFCPSSLTTLACQLVSVRLAAMTHPGTKIPSLLCAI